MFVEVYDSVCKFILMATIHEWKLWGVCGNKRFDNLQQCVGKESRTEN